MSTQQYENNKPTGKPRISPPWYSLQRQISFTFGQSSQVLVSELIGDGPEYTLRLVALRKESAQALANVVKSAFSFGGSTVLIVVTDLDGNKYGPTERTPTLEDLKGAVFNNPLVFDVAEKSIACLPVVVQYWNDDISNPDGVTSMLSSEAFNEVVVSPVSAYTIGRKLGNS